MLPVVLGSYFENLKFARWELPSAKLTTNRRKPPLVTWPGKWVQC